MPYDMNNQRKKRTVYILQRALLDLMIERPYESINIVDICTKAMVHRTTFYHHFENKNQLLEYAVCCIKEQVEVNIFQDEKTYTPQGYYIGFLDKLIEYLDNNPLLCRALIDGSSNEIFWTKLQDIIAYDVKCKMSEFARKGYVYNVSLQFNTQFFTAGILGTFLWWLRNNKPIPQEEFLKYTSVLIDPRGELRQKVKASGNEDSDK